MAGWSRHDGTAVALPRDNIDTDQLIPARFMSASRAEGYGQFLLRDLREGDPDFPLDRFPQASILLAGRNFGCGSSREAAVYALVDAGIRCVIATGFGDIFAANAVNNGLLPARLAETPAVMQALAGRTTSASIDLET
ncbi:MAG: 3-isopropylmalate dehydratase small subunit, partial [Rhodobacterales bacterium]